MTHVLVGGDLCPVGVNMPLFEKGDAAAVFGEFLTEFQEADLAMLNLECPLIREKTPIEKMGPVLSPSQKSVKGLKAAGIDVANLANNHIMDHGVPGLRSTIAALEDQGIAYVGAGENLQEARRVLVCHLDGMAIGIFSVAEREFSIAGKNLPGANPLDVIDFVRAVQEHCCDWDCLVVLFHGGNEYYPYPSPWLKNTCRFMAEQGANVIICQHSHCVGCMEVYRGVPIVYGQGNLLFDKPTPQNPWWYKGALVSLDIGAGEAIQVTLIPFKQIRHEPGIHPMSQEERTALLAGFEDRSKAIEDDETCEALWSQFCAGRRNDYLHCLYGNQSIVCRALEKAQLLDRFYTRTKLRCSRSVVQCESHREVLLEILTKGS